MRNILITRPTSSAEILADKIRSIGFNPIVFPMIEIVEIPDILIPDLSLIDIIIFISPTAVDMFPLKEQILNIKFFAVGKETAEKIQQKNWGEAIYPLDKYGAEYLLDLPELKEIKNKSILICKGVGGNPLIKETLTKRGGKVEEINLYKRQIPKYNSTPDLDNIDLIICTSGESLYNLITLFGNKIKEKHLLVSSEKLKLLAENLGFKYKPLIAENAGDDALKEKLCSYYQHNP